MISTIMVCTKIVTASPSEFKSKIYVVVSNETIFGNDYLKNYFLIVIMTDTKRCQRV